MSDIVIYDDGTVTLKTTVEDESVWLNQKQMSGNSGHLWYCWSLFQHRSKKRLLD